MPSNHSSIADVEATLLYEMVGHKGPRDLFGDKFEAFLDAVYENVYNDVKERIDLLATQNGWNRRTATEEYMAGLSEDGIFKDVKSVWRKSCDTGDGNYPFLTVGGGLITAVEY